MKLQQIAYGRCFQWIAVILAAIPCIYIMDLFKLGAIGFVKFGWDNRPFVSIQTQSAFAFISYSTAVALISALAGMLSHKRLFIWAALIAILALGCFAVGVVTYSLGVLPPRQ